MSNLEMIVQTEPSNLYECELGDKVFVGPFVEITNGVKIGKNSSRVIVLSVIL